MSAAYQYVNRKGDAYFLQSKQGKGDAPKYSFARKISGTPMARLPEGYEVREHPETAQVVIRKIQPSAVLPLEKRLLEKTICQQTDGLLFILDVEERSLVVYTSEMDADVRIEALRQVFPMDAATARRMKADTIARARYAKMMRFTLIDEPKRLFNLDRWCFSGGIDNWYFLEGGEPLVRLAEKYVRHLGQESFFDLI